MTRRFAVIAGSILIIVGFLNLFLIKQDLFHAGPAHSLVHILAGVLGIILKKNHRGYSLWVGVFGVGFAIVGFAGVQQLTKWIDLSTVFNYFHAILGSAGLLVYLGDKNKIQPSGLPSQNETSGPDLPSTVKPS